MQKYKYTLFVFNCQERTMCNAVPDSKSTGLVELKCGRAPGKLAKCYEITDIDRIAF